MGVVVELEGRVAWRLPAGADALPLASGCDWGYCTRPGVAWRRLGGRWLVVCARCVSAPLPEPDFLG